MLRQGSGVIVNVISVLAERGVPNASLYCMAKAGVLNLTRALALEWARKGVRVNALETGWLEEPASPTNADEDFNKFGARHRVEGHTSFSGYGSCEESFACSWRANE